MATRLEVGNDHVSEPTEPKPDQMWINAFSLVSPSDEVLKGIGTDIVSLLKSSSFRRREEGLDPLMEITIRIVAT